MRRCDSHGGPTLDEKKLEEGIDFYWEGPFLVFTEQYLRTRGSCCESGCRHCPWGFGDNVRKDGPEECD